MECQAVLKTVSEKCLRDCSLNFPRKKKIAGKEPNKVEDVRVSSKERRRVRGDGYDELDETRGKGKGKGNGGKREHGSKEGFGGKGFQQSVEMMKGEEAQGADEDERVELAPNMGAGGSHPQATFDPEEAEEEEKETEKQQQRKEGQYSEPGQWY